MRRLSERARLYINSYYIGSGNKTSVFMRRPTRPFEKIREIYGEELERFKEDKTNSAPKHIPLTIEQKNIIRKRINKELRLDFIKNISAIIIALGLATGLFFGLRAVIYFLIEISNYTLI